MPLYELAMVIRPCTKQEVVDCLKRTADVLWRNGGVITKLEFLGQSKLPYSLSRCTGDPSYKEGARFVYSFSMNYSKIQSVRPALKLDVDLLRRQIFFQDEFKLDDKKDQNECTLEEELQPPALRKSVQPLIQHKNVRADVIQTHTL